MNETIFLSSVMKVSDQFSNESSELRHDELQYWETALSNSRYTVQRILVPIVVIVGAVGNSITIVVLTRRHMQTSTNVYLTALAISDMLYLIFMFSLSLKHIPGMSHEDNWMYWHYFRYALWLTDASSSTSIWLTVTFTIERYIAVCHPIKGKVFCTHSKAKRVIVAVYLLCFLLTVTTPHEWVVLRDASTNGTHLALGQSDLGSNMTYKTVFYWFSAVTFILLPLALLAAFNTFLILAVKRSKRQRIVMVGQRLKRNSQVNQENKITIMLIAVVLLALLCQLPTAAMLIYSSFYEPQPETDSYFICIILNNLFNLLTAVNAAANFIFYCALSDRYRRTFLQTFCRKWYEKHSHQPSWMATTGYSNFEDGSPQTSMRGSIRISRRPSNRSSLSSNSRAGLSHTSFRALDQQSGNTFLSVPPAQSFGSNQLEEIEDSFTLSRFSSPSSSSGHSTSQSNYANRLELIFHADGTVEPTDKEKRQEFDDLPTTPAEHLNVFRGNSVATQPQKTSPRLKDKDHLRQFMGRLSLGNCNKSSSGSYRGQNIIITCQTPSTDEQTAV